MGEIRRTDFSDSPTRGLLSVEKVPGGRIKEGAKSLLKGIIKVVESSPQSREELMNTAVILGITESRARTDYMIRSEMTEDEVLELSNNAREAMDILSSEEQEIAKAEIYKVTRPSATKEV
jgi:hypothetical protein